MRSIARLDEMQLAFACMAVSTPGHSLVTTLRAQLTQIVPIVHGLARPGLPLWPQNVPCGGPGSSDSFR
jgi:hypothetical protein